MASGLLFLFNLSLTCLILNDPVTSCLDLTFSLSPIFPPLSHSYSLSLGPAYHCGWSRLIPPSPSFISFISLIHYIFTRSFTQFSDFHTFLPFSSLYPGPACHCGRSRLLPSFSYHIYISLFPFTDPHRSSQIPHGSSQILLILTDPSLNLTDPLTFFPLFIYPIISLIGPASHPPLFYPCLPIFYIS